MKNRRLAISIALSVFIIILIVVYMLTIGDNPYVIKPLISLGLVIIFYGSIQKQFIKSKWWIYLAAICFDTMNYLFSFNSMYLIIIAIDIVVLLIFNSIINKIDKRYTNDSQ